MIFLVVSVMLVFAMVGTANAGVNFYQVTGDGDCGITDPGSYTHAIDFDPLVIQTPMDPPAIVNGLIFAGNIGVAIPGGPSNLGSRTFGTEYNEGGGVLPPAVTGDIFDVFQSMTFSAAQSGGNIELTGLTPGQLYDFRIYDRAWGYGVYPRKVRYEFDVDSDGSVEETTTFDQDFPNLAPINMSGDVSWVMSYVYQAGDNGTLLINIDQKLDGTYPYHLYGLTNQAIPEPATMLLLGLGSLVAARRRRRC